VEGMCEVCGEKGKVVHHHISYEQDVTVLLCHKCHQKAHRNGIPIYKPIDKNTKRRKGEDYKHVKVVIGKKMREKVVEYARENGLTMPRAYGEIVEIGIKALNL